MSISVFHHQVELALSGNSSFTMEAYSASYRDFMALVDRLSSANVTRFQLIGRDIQERLSNITDGRFWTHILSSLEQRLTSLDAMTALDTSM